MEQYLIKIPVEITREGIKASLLKANKIKESSNEILLDKMLYVIAEIHRVSLKVYFEDEKGVELTHLHSKFLKKNLGRSGGITYKQVIDYLLLVDLIDVDESYKISNYSKGYGIKNRNKLFHVYQVELKHWKPKPRKGSLETKPDGLNLLSAIRDNIARVDIDWSYVELANMNETSMYAVTSALYNLNSSTKRYGRSSAFPKKIKDIYLTEDDYGRLHHNLTGIGRKYRPALTVDGEDIYSTDLSASQMYFGIKGLVGYAKMKANKKNWEDVCKKLPDVPEYIDTVLNGQFYNAINEFLEFTPEELKANKIKTLMPIFSKKDPKRKTKYLKALEAKFPTFLAFINTKKKNDYADAARFLQREESTIMIEKVCGRLTDLGIWFVPVHDCILSKQCDLATVKQIIEEECEAYNGYKPHMKTSNWTGAKQPLAFPLTREDRAKHLSENSLAYKMFINKTTVNQTIKKIISNSKRL